MEVEKKRETSQNLRMASNKLIFRLRRSLMDSIEELEAKLKGDVGEWEEMIYGASI